MCVVPTPFCVLAVQGLRSEFLLVGANSYLHMWQLRASAVLFPMSVCSCPTQTPSSCCVCYMHSLGETNVKLTYYQRAVDELSSPVAQMPDFSAEPQHLSVQVSALRCCSSPLIKPDAPVLSARLSCWSKMCFAVDFAFAGSLLRHQYLQCSSWCPKQFPFHGSHPDGRC